MKRAAIEKDRAKRVWAAHQRLSHQAIPGTDTGCVCDQQVNRFRKGQRASGCNKGRRCMCKYHKYWGKEDRPKLLRADQKQQYEMQEVNLS